MILHDRIPSVPARCDSLLLLQQLYWGRYATLNRIEDIENITIESSWGSPEDTRKDIFVYKIQDDLQKPRLEYTGKSNPVVSLASKDILLRHHNGGFESITFDGFGGANLKYNEDHKSKYVDIDTWISSSRV